MDKLRALLQDVQAWLAAATPRERRLLSLAAGGVVLFIALIGWASFSSSIRKAQNNLEEKQLDFEKISRLAAGYGAQEQERQMLEARLRQSPPALMGFIDNLARQDGVEIGSVQDRGVVAGGKAGAPRETSIETNLSKVPLDKLVKLLADIEHSPGVVRTRRVRLRKSSDNKDTLDVTLSVSAWQGS